eukprot:TRINITY_DN48968_c0_g1_i1.p2 TRINITY_DN48968_c0_g1~~TRINITY_DN48968_c0_g1_i1.p2  ORF type:complete len:110 (+),score=13.47 TRINITY_DN48968_c0_g1_i1:266-595(+)
MKNKAVTNQTQSGPLSFLFFFVFCFFFFHFIVDHAQPPSPVFCFRGLLHPLVAACGDTKRSKYEHRKRKKKATFVCVALPPDYTTTSPHAPLFYCFSNAIFLFFFFFFF